MNFQIGAHSSLHAEAIHIRRPKTHFRKRFCDTTTATGIASWCCNIISTSFYPALSISRAKAIKKEGLFVSITRKRDKNYLQISHIDIVYPDEYLSLQSSDINIISFDIYIIHPDEYLSLRSPNINIVSSDINIIHPN